MESGNILPGGLFVRRLFQVFIFGSASGSLRTFSSLHVSDYDVDGVVTWWTTGSFTQNFFSTLQLYLLFSGQGLLEGDSIFPSADIFWWLHTFLDSIKLARCGPF
ncbi:hypothetical protein TNCV_2743821 [Trichonephila clavipes]|nr:hypothetical protein TNCV_2743821 [Trichonephila clavipes]